MDGWMGGWMDGWMYGWMDGWMEMDGWMDGWILFYRCRKDIFYLLFPDTYNILIFLLFLYIYFVFNARQINNFYNIPRYLKSDISQTVLCKLRVL